MNILTLKADYLKIANYALFHNKIPVCTAIDCTNTSEKPVEDVKVTCNGEFISQFTSDAITRIDPGETVRIKPFSINIDPVKLASLTERVITSFTLTATSKDETVGEAVCEIELMPYDHWTGMKILPQTIVSFITPNNPAINKLVVETGAMMKKLSGSSVLKGYQSGDPNDVCQQVAAVFAALHNTGIIYRSLPPGYEEMGQRVTLPDQVALSKIGNCIELTLLFASVLEAIGLNTLIMFQNGHAYLGVWLLDDCYQCSVGDDPAYIEKRCSKGINEILLIESTNVAQESSSFKEAVKIAELNIARHDEFIMFVDVKRSRLEKILPLPTRIENNGQWVFETQGIDHDSCKLDVKEHDRYDLSQITATDKELTKFDIWERKLLDFSLRNSLLNLSLRRRAVQFISFAVNRVEDHLQDGEEYCILPKPNVEVSFDTRENLIRSKLHDSLQELILNDTEHHVLHTFLTENETKVVLKNIYRAARNAIEETGANSLFLSIGTLRWFETDQSVVPRYAPLLLLPVELIYKKGNYYIRTRDEEISLNITLMEFLRQNYGITINGLNPLPLDDSGVDVPLIFAIVRDALKSRKRWDIEEECVLGTFSFNKFLMWNDIHTHRELLIDNKIISSLIANTLTWKPDPVVSNLKDIDLTLSPEDTALPMAVDSSQMAAVIEGGNGNSFILYGPPGTGKSQTITNLISNALYHNKRVLFVAEKMAALSVVQSRLAKIGLDPFCLELHSNKSTKRHVLQQLEKALKVVHIIPPADYNAKAQKIFERRKELISYMNALHHIHASDGLSLYDCILRMESMSEEPLDNFMYDKAIDTLICKEGLNGVEEFLGTRLETVLKLNGSPANHPLKGLHLTRKMLMDSGLAQHFKEYSATMEDYCRDHGNLVDAPELRKKLMRDNDEAIFNEDPEALRREWRTVKAKWFIPRFFAKRNFIGRLRQYNPLINPDELDPLIEDLISYRQKHEKIENLNRIIGQFFEIKTKEDVMPSLEQLEEAKAKFNLWANNSSRMRDWLHWVEYADELRKNGMGCVVDSLESDDQHLHDIKGSYLKSLLKHKAEDKISQSETLITFEGMLFDDKVEAYKRLTEEFRLLTQKELYARLASRVPRMTDNISNGSEIGLLNRNISNGGRGMSLRDLFDQLPTLLPLLCPCMLMSPMSAAQYIDLKAEKFDLVIFDEASQMPTSEAIGAIARGKSLIVVGDPKQMPPTSFFSSTNVDAEEAVIDDMESILEDCRTLEMPSLQLSWHYRSRHESLIAFSNNEYYDGTLITFPSVDDKRTKVHFIPVEGYYDKGGKRSNKEEADAIVNEIIRRLQDEDLRKQSIGVIAFNVMQQGLIEDVLQERLEKDKSLQEAAQGMYEPIFIKNLENVQGDERDVIMFSIGYGPDKSGKISMNFGPLNNNGGERRLNVAVSRARCEMFIFSTLKSADIDMRRTKARGVEGLKHFLEYAETRSLPTKSQAQSIHHPSVIAEQIAAELRKLGYAAVTNVGRSQFRVDVAVEKDKESGVYGLGILLDGENYRDTNTTRDREVVQPSTLNSLNWKVMRVWTVDWYNNKHRVISRIEERLKEKESEEEVKPQTFTFDISKEKVQKIKSNAKDYEKYRIDINSAGIMTDIYLMSRIIEKEQPINFNYLCRRATDLRGGTRVLKSLQESFKSYTEEFYTDSLGALWMNEEASHDYAYYRPESDRDPSEIPAVELHNAIVETLTEQVALNEDNLSFLASKKFGNTRRGTNLYNTVRNAVKSLVDSGMIEMIGDNLRLKTAD